MYQFQAFKLSISSELYFPELLPDNRAGLPDISILYEKVSTSGLTDPLKEGPFFQLNKDMMWFNIPKVARFLVMYGRKITIDPCKRIDEATLRAFILDCCFKALLIQRGLFLFHGNAIQVGDYAVSFVAPSGFGKSTLCHLFLKKGHTILSDEICALDQNLHVLPSYPQISLWKTICGQLDIKTDIRRRVRPQLEKYAISLNQQQFHSNTLPIKLIYMLNYHKKNEVKFTALSHTSKLEFIADCVSHSPYIPSFIQHTLHKQYHVIMAQQIKVIKLQCPRWDYTMHELGYLMAHIFDSIEANIMHWNL